MLDRDPSACIDGRWWRNRIAAAVARRRGIASETTGYRLVHAEGDGAPSLICDRYDRWLVVQLLSAGLEACRSDIVEALVDIGLPAGILARNDAAVRRKEGLATTVEVLTGDVPREIEVDRARGPIPCSALGRSKNRRLPRSTREPCDRRD